MELLTVLPLDRLLIEMRAIEDIYQDRIKAMAFKTKADKELTAGAKQEVIKLYLEENASSRGKLLILVTTLGTVLFFIAQAVGEGFFQDVIYEPLKAYWQQKNFITK